jgi:hypothetical protein
MVPIVIAAIAYTDGQAAIASCGVGGPGGPSVGDQLAAAPVVFVGTVIYTSDQDRVARVKVESIWKGPALPAYLYVHGSPVSGPFTASSVDRHYQSGHRYLFVPVNTSTPFDDNICSLTQPYTAELSAYAPPDARTPSPATGFDYVQNFVGQNAWFVALALLAAAGSIAFLWFRRRSTASMSRR